MCKSYVNGDIHIESVLYFLIWSWMETINQAAIHLCNLHYMRIKILSGLNNYFHCALEFGDNYTQLNNLGDKCFCTTGGMSLSSITPGIDVSTIMAPMVRRKLAPPKLLWIWGGNFQLSLAHENIGATTKIVINKGPICIANLATGTITAFELVCLNKVEHFYSKNNFRNSSDIRNPSILMHLSLALNLGQEM